jgi:dTDP-4-dehydrorhamnose reductase
MMGTFAGNILITGSRGQLGCELMRILSRRGPVLGVTHADLDITDRTAVPAYVKTVKPTVVIHCAAWTDVDACEIDADRAMAVNADGCRNVANACQSVGAAMMYFSTDYVFDGQKSAPYVEDDPPNPLSVYGKSKLAGEKAVRDLVERHVIMRISWVYGANGANFIKTMLGLGRKQIDAVKAGLRYEPLKVVDDQTGCPTWAVDIATQTEMLISRQMTGTFHVAAGGAVTRYALARELFNSLAMNVELIPCTTDELARPAPRPRYSVMENRRLIEAGCNIMPAYNDSLRRFLADFLRR